MKYAKNDVQGVFWNPDTRAMEPIEPGRAYPDNHALVREFPRMFQSAAPAVRAYGAAHLAPVVTQVRLS